MVLGMISEATKDQDGHKRGNDPHHKIFSKFDPKKRLCAVPYNWAYAAFAWTPTKMRPRYVLWCLGKYRDQRLVNIFF